MSQNYEAVLELIKKIVQPYCPGNNGMLLKCVSVLIVTNSKRYLMTHYNFIND